MARQQYDNKGELAGGGEKGGGSQKRTIETRPEQATRVGRRRRPFVTSYFKHAVIVLADCARILCNVSISCTIRMLR